jgi:hypothetical protein
MVYGPLHADQLPAPQGLAHPALLDQPDTTQHHSVQNQQQQRLRSWLEQLKNWGTAMTNCLTSAPVL